MSSRYWLLILALGGCLSAFALAEGAEQQPQKAPSTQPGAPETNTHPQIDPDAINAIRRDIARISSTLEAIAAQADSPEDQERQYSDLDAQWSMAQAAFWMVMLTLIQVVIGSFGIFYIRETLRETARAAKAAQASAEVIPRLERSYIFVESELGTDSIKSVLNVIGNGKNSFYKFPHFTFHLRNNGRTPASISRIRAGAKYGPASDPPLYEQDITYSVHSLAAGGKTPTYRAVFDPDDATPSMLPEVYSGTNTFRLYVRVEFEDVFGASYTTSWYWHYNAQKMALEPCHAAGPQYNEYNKPVKS